jgi:hypothetical protein
LYAFSTHRPWNIIIVQAVALKQRRKWECNGIAAKVAGKRNMRIILSPTFRNTNDGGLEA